MEPTNKPVATLPIRGQDIEVRLSIQVRADSATADFMATVGDNTLYADTLDKLRQRLMAETARQAVKVSVPFEQIVRGGWQRHEPYSVRRGTLTGIHAKTRALLVRWADGKTNQMQYARDLLRPLDKATAAQLVALYTERDRIVLAIDELEKANRLDGREAVEAAIAAATSSD